MDCSRSRRTSKASAGGQLEQPSDVNSSTITGTGVAEASGRFMEDPSRREISSALFLRAWATTTQKATIKKAVIASFVITGSSTGWSLGLRRGYAGDPGRKFCAGINRRASFNRLLDAREDGVGQHARNES